MAVELIYDDDCPNVDQARENISAALAACGRRPHWTEWDRSATGSPSYVNSFGSPTVLVDGRDVSGQPSGGGDCCRLYRSGIGGFDGAPSVEQIGAALQLASVSETSGRSLRFGWNNIAATLPAVGAAMLPVGLCPACWPAYGGLLGALGLGFLLNTAYLFPLTAVLLAVAVGALALDARRRHGYGPFVLGLAASAVVLAGKFAFSSNVAMYGGIVVLVAASIWNAWPLWEKNPAACPCASGSSNS